MVESEWITWEVCPSCGDRAAVGWRDAGAPIEFDCPAGCRLTICELVRTFPPGDGTGSAERAAHVEHLPVYGVPCAAEVACDAVRWGAAAITTAAGLGGAARVTVWRPDHS